MKKTLLVIFTLLLSILLAACGGSSAPAPTAAPTTAPADTSNTGELQVFTEEFPPITFSKDGKASGLASEVAEEIMKRSGVNATIQVVPWARGYKALEQGPTTALFTTMRTEEREKLFKWVGPLVEQNTNFYALKDSKITIASLDDAKKIDSIGVITDYYSQQFLAGKGFTNLDASADANALVRKLLAGRISLMVSDSITLGEVLKANGAKPEDVKAVYTFITTQSYIAFSLDTPDDMVQQWQKALDAMKADGTFAKIYGKWLPGEVPPQ
jgi:polar amino acid transport system substrate-binding protein